MSGGHECVVVELVGPAGAGKTSVARLLGERNATWRVRPRPGAASHFRTAAGLVPTYLGLQAVAHRPAWKEMKRVTYLESLARLAAHPPGDAHAMIFDEGPIYMLARLRQYGADVVDHPALAGWWAASLHRWAQALHMVVWLDAADETLAARVLARTGPHRIKGLSRRETDAFLRSYRAIYRELLARLSEHHTLRVLECRTDQLRVGDTVLLVEQEVQELRGRA